MNQNQFVTAAENIELGQLYSILQKQESAKIDMITPPRSVFMKNNIVHVVREDRPTMRLDMTKLSLDQICGKLGIPPQYAQKMLTNVPGLLDANVNGWLEKEMTDDGRNFMLRTYSVDGDTGTLRAVLSDKYFDISTFRLMSEVIAVVNEMQHETGIEIKAQKCDLTEQNIFCRFIAPELEQRSTVLKYFKDATTGNRNPGFFTGVIFKNSEVGKGMYTIAPRIITGACQNGNIYTSESIRRMHIGERLDVGEIQWSKETIELEIQSIMSKTRDAFRRWLSKEFLGKTVEQFEAAAEIKLHYPIDTVVNVAQELALPKKTTQSVIEYLNGCGMGDTAFGVIQAFTGVARDLSPDDRWRIEDAVTEKLLIGDVDKYDHRNRAARKFIMN